MSASTMRIAIVGAESTGKTTLARELGVALAQHTGQRVAVVAEWLREWCDAAGRTPRPDEQAAILREQHARIEAAAERHAIVVADTTGLMTAVYSCLLFADASLEAAAVAWQRTVAVTLLTALDLPWVADGHQRDGAHVREPVDAALRAVLSRHALPYHVIGGEGRTRLAQALAALQPALRGIGHAAGTARNGGIFSGLAMTEGDRSGGAVARRWSCDCCWPDGERALRARTRRSGHP